MIKILNKPKYITCMRQIMTFTISAISLTSANSKELRNIFLKGKFITATLSLKSILDFFFSFLFCEKESKYKQTTVSPELAELSFGLGIRAPIPMMSSHLQCIPWH